MKRIAPRLFLLLLAALPATAGGCFGGTQNVSYFPYLWPFGDIIPTHAKPGGSGYYANFDPHAVRLEVRPLGPENATNQVRTQHVLIATVYDEKDKPRRQRRVEWIIEGVGNIIEADEHGCTPVAATRKARSTPSPTPAWTNFASVAATKTRRTTS